MGLKCGIVGLPNVGKSTLFNSLSNAKAQAANFPFCTKEPNVGMITVPDDRLNQLEDIINPKQVVPNVIEIVDIAGLIKGASKGDGLGNQFLANIRETNAIIHVVRCFDDANVVHVDGSVDPIRDKEVIDTELQLKDLETVENKISKATKQSKGGDKKQVKLKEDLETVMNNLLKGVSIRDLELDEDELESIADLQLLTAKPVLYVCNVDEDTIRNGTNQYVEVVRGIAEREGSGLLVICAKVEEDIADLETYEDKQMFLEDLGLEESGVQKLIREAYKLLDLSTYFTAGEKEVRAWTINRNATAPKAAGEIHTDFEKGFIRAEVIKYDDFLIHKSWPACREAGKISVEGKTYEVQDGDIILFRFNV